MKEKLELLENEEKKMYRLFPEILNFSRYFESPREQNPLMENVRKKSGMLEEKFLASIIQNALS